MSKPLPPVHERASAVIGVLHGQTRFEVDPISRRKIKDAKHSIGQLNSEPFRFFPALSIEIDQDGVMAGTQFVLRFDNFANN